MLFTILVLLLFISSGDNSRIEKSKNVIPLNSWNLSSTSTPFAQPILVKVPSSIVGGLVQAKAPGFDFDPLYGKNLDKIKESLFTVPWIYETTVNIESIRSNEVLLLCFNGLNYKADVWVNDVQVGSKKNLVGPFRHFRIDITEVVKKNIVNVRVEIVRPNDFCFPPDNNSTDLAITFVDWIHHPPDYSMGLIRPVFLQRVIFSPYSFTLEGPVVDTKLDKELKTATLTVSYVVKNWENTTIKKQTFYTDLGLAGVKNLEKTIPEIPAGDSVRVEFDAVQINIDNPKEMLWWPWQMGKPNMFTLTCGVIDNNKEVTYLTTKYGIREITSKLSEFNFLQFYVNGKYVLIRSGGWAPDLLIREIQLRDQYKLVRDMNLNSIRSEGKMESDSFWDLADEFGILMFPGWCCCDAWQHWKYWKSEQYFIAQESMRTQARRLAIHPSIAVFLYSSDELPPPDVEKLFLNVLEEEKWPNPTISSASERTSTITGPTGVKMSGPYSWVPPNYWLEDKSYTHHLGGAYGFLTEGGPGESPLTLRSWKRTVPEEHVWEKEGSMSDWWNYHCANPVGIFRNLRFFTPPLNERYGEANNAAEYLYKSQAMAYEGMRAFYEAYARNRHQNATGLVQWMLNNAGNQHVWHQYDHFLSAGGGYYGTKRANEPLHVMLSYTDGSVWIMNQIYDSIESKISIRAEILRITGEVVWSKETSVSRLDEDASKMLPDFVVPLDGAGKFKKHETFFVRLIWENEENEWVNTYWLSPTKDILNWKESTFYRTPCSQYSNFQQLKELKSVELKTKVTKGKQKVEVEVSNPEDSQTMAFLIEVIAMDAKNPGVDVTPVFWTDNWFTLKPGDSRKVETELPEGIESDDVDIVVESWNEIVVN